LHPPIQLEKSDFELVVAIFEAAGELERRAGRNAQHLRSSRRMLADTALRSVLHGSRRGVVSSGALRAIARTEPAWLLSSPIRWAVRHARRQTRAVISGADRRSPLG